MAESRLSVKTRAVLGLIAEGHGYAQIVDAHPGLTYLDIFAAAEEALRLDEAPSDYERRMAEIKRRHPRAYTPWSPEEDRELDAMFRRGEIAAAMAVHLGRQPSAIRSRLAKLGLGGPADDLGGTR